MRRGWAIFGGVGGDMVGDEGEGDDWGFGDLGIRSLRSLRLQMSFSWVSVVEKSGHDIPSEASFSMLSGTPRGRPLGVE